LHEKLTINVQNVVHLHARMLSVAFSTLIAASTAFCQQGAASAHWCHRTYSCST